MISEIAANFSLNTSLRLKSKYELNLNIIKVFQACHIKIVNYVTKLNSIILNHSRSICSIINRTDSLLVSYLFVCKSSDIS